MFRDGRPADSKADVNAVAFEHIDKSFGAVAALRDVTFAITRGAANIFAGREITGRFGWLRESEMRARRALPPAPDLLKAGKVQVLLGQKYFGWGSESVRLLAGIKAGKMPANPIIDSGVDVVTAANVDQ